MSVETSESTASTPRERRLEGVPQNQYFYVLYFDYNDRFYKAVDIEGHICHKSQDQETVSWAVSNAVGKGTVLFMAGEYKPKSLDNVSIAGVGPKHTRIVCDVNATAVVLSDLTVEGRASISNGLVERCAFPGQASFVSCSLNKTIAREMVSSDSILTDCQADKLLSSGDKISYSVFKNVRLDGSSGHIIQSNNIGTLHSRASTGVVSHNTIERLMLEETAGVIASNFVKETELDDKSTAVIKDNAGLISENYGRAVFSGDGASDSFVVEHGLIRRPRFVGVWPGSAGTVRRDYFYEYDSRDIRVKFSSAPLAGAANVQLHWLARI